ASEVLRLRMEADQRRAAELEVIRAQLAEVREATTRQVRVVRPRLQIESAPAATDARPLRALAMDAADPTWAPPPNLRSTNGVRRRGPTPGADPGESSGSRD